MKYICEQFRNIPQSIYFTYYQFIKNIGQTIVRLLQIQLNYITTWGLEVYIQNYPVSAIQKLFRLLGNLKTLFYLLLTQSDG